MSAASIPKPSVPFSCLPRLLEHHAERIPDAAAIFAPGRVPLTYARLHQRIDTVRRTLRRIGLGRRDRIGVILPNGPDMAVATLGVMACATCVPMNPALGGREAGEYLAALRISAVITQADADIPARRAALSRGIRVIELAAAPDAEAGLFTLTAEQDRAASDEPCDAHDIALLLPTSGTTRRPKTVPMTHANLCVSAFYSAAAVALTEDDRCINMMPLFHGHGLTNVLLSSLAAGAGVVCTSGCDPGRVLGWLTEFRPTWYSAVPAMHQAILAEAGESRARAADARLRFIRSASASLPPHLLTELERTFQTCVIEAYGMTETSSCPIASNPLPPRQRKPGSVGVPVGLDVAVMDERGALVPARRTGEVVVRGASVMTGYDGDRAMTDAAFAGDWFKTGDLGFFDDDGYLFLSGRIRDMINRGGEKVAPQEVDDVLLQHPAVAEAATFAVPHVTLGEDIACAVVLRPRCAATPKDIRQFAAARMAGFKVPHQVVVVDTIPKGPTGKLQRSGLAAKMGIGKDAAPQRGVVAPRTPLEQALAASWQEILRIEQIGIHDDFFVSGGDSLLAARALADIYDLTQVEFDVSRFFDAPTIADVADYLERALDGGLRPPSERGIARAPRQNGMMPASIAQERMWNLQRAAADMPLFNVVHTLRVASCDAAILERSLNDIAQRHETLRTTFTAIDGRLMQVIASRSSVPMRFDDLHRLAAAEKAATVQKFMRERLLHSFDLAHGPLVCAHLMRVAEQEDLLLIAMAGIIQDGWSLGLLIDELAELYGAAAQGRIARLAPLPIQYADFAQWQRRWRENPGMVAQLAYWREQLRDPLPVLELARPKQATNDFRTGRQKVALPPELAESARRFSRREGVTLFMTLLAAFKIVLYRRTGEGDVRVATHVANRNRPHTTRLIGPLVNTVILRTALNGDLGSREVVRRVRAAALAAYGNQDLPFEEVAAVLNEERGLEPAALAPALMWLQNDTLRPVASTGTALSFEEVDPSMLLPLVTLTGFDVTLMLRETTDGLVGTCVYQSRLFSSKTIDRLLADFQRVLEILVVEPDRPISTFPVATSEEKSSEYQSDP